MTTRLVKTGNKTTRMLRLTAYPVIILLLAFPAWSEGSIDVISADGSLYGKIPVQVENGLERISVTLWSALLGADLSWDYVTGTADMRFRDSHLRFADKGRGVWINGRMHSLPGAVVQQDGDLWVPVKILDDIVDALWEGDVIWHAAERELRRHATRPRAPDIRQQEYDDGHLVIVLDAGHGGADTGCVSPDGVLEKDVVLAIVNRVGDIIANRIGAHVELTRSADSDVPVEERTSKANSVRADLFISFHIAPPEEMPEQSFRIFVLPSGQAASDAVSKPPLWESRSQALMDTTRMYAEQFAGGISLTANMKDYSIQSRDLLVLKGLSMPAFVLELSWDSSFYGNVRISGEAGSNRAAEAIFDGIRRVLEME